MIHTIRKILPLILIVLFLFSSFQTAYAKQIAEPISTDDIDSAIALGLDFIAGQQNADGGIRWIDENSSVPATVRVVLALAASGFSQDFIKSDSDLTPLDYLEASGFEWILQSSDEKDTVNVGRAGQLLTAIAAANQNPYAFGDQKINLIRKINDQFDQKRGSFGTASPENVLDQVWAILGLAAHNAPIPQSAIDWLKEVQSDKGYWDDGFGDYLDTTPLALMALIASGYSNSGSTEIQKGISYLLLNQNDRKAWQTEWDTTTNASITSEVLQAINAIGDSPRKAPWGDEVENPISALFLIQQDNGAFGADYANSYSTADAIIGLSGFTLFNLGYVRQINQGFQFILNSQQPDGGWENVGLTVDVILALQSAGWDPNSIIRGENTPIEFIQQNYPSYIERGPDAIGKTIMGIVASGGDPTHFNNTDLVEILYNTYDESIKAFGDPNNTWHQSLAILGLYSADEDIPPGAIETLKELQQSDGGWDYTSGSFGSFPDHTSIALQALLAAGISSTDPIILSGIEFIESNQNMKGDWGDSSTSAYALMAFNVLDEPGPHLHPETGKISQRALFSFQKPNGSFYFDKNYPNDSLMPTASALLALVGGNYILENINPENSRAGLIIDPGDGNWTTACISFPSDSINGMDLLMESGIDFSTTDDGFMENIMGISNPQGGNMYWSYWGWDGREWQFKETGAGASFVQKGTIEAWLFSSWETFPSSPPISVPGFREICPSTSLMSYTAHPYLSYLDLSAVFNIQSEFPDKTPTPSEVADEEITKLSPEISPEASPTQVQISETTGSEPGVDELDTRMESILPIIIITLVGAMSILFIFIASSKEKH